MAQEADSGVVPARSAFSLGWLMAVMYRPPDASGDVTAGGHLPSVAELSRDDRMHLTFNQFDALLRSLQLDAVNSSRLREKWLPGQPVSEEFRLELFDIHRRILDDLIVRDTRLVAAYQLGRDLRDTCWLPNHDDGAQSFLRQFSRSRLAPMNAWLGQADKGLPTGTAVIVGRSLKNWQEWTDANAGTLDRRWDKNSAAVLVALQAQGQAWQQLLSGELDSTLEPDVGAWMLAGQSLVRSARDLTRKVLSHFWVAALVVVAAVVGLLFVSFQNSHGATRVWTSLATVAGGLGITGSGLRSATKKAGGQIEQWVWRAAQLDAQAWAVTLLPVLWLGPLRRQRLRTAGVSRPTAGRKLRSLIRERPATTSPAAPAVRAARDG